MQISEPVLHRTTTGQPTPPTTRTRRRGGHQPYGWDQITAFYSKYRVLGAKLIIKFYPAGAQSYNCAVQLTEDTSAPAGNIAAELEKENTSYGIVTQYRELDIVSTYSHLKNPRDDVVYTATNANPSDPVYFQIMAQLISAGAGGSGVYYMVTIDWNVEFIHPVELTQS